MSKLYASLNADAGKTDATRRGHRSINAHVRGWTLGVRVVAGLDGHGDEMFEVYVTSGSNGGPADDLVGRVCLHDGHRYFFPVSRDDVRSREQARWLACEEVSPA